MKCYTNNLLQFFLILCANVCSNTAICKPTTVPGHVRMGVETHRTHPVNETNHQMFSSLHDTESTDLRLTTEKYDIALVPDVYPRGHSSGT